MLVTGYHLHIYILTKMKLKGFLALNGHVPNEDKSDYTKDSFQMDWIHFAYCKVQWQALVNILC